MAAAEQKEGEEKEKDDSQPAAGKREGRREGVKEKMSAVTSRSAQAYARPAASPLCGGVRWDACRAAQTQLV